MKSAAIGGLEFSAVGLGTSGFTKHCDEREAGRIVREALDAGITMFDTADSYGAERCGRSEQVLGTALAGMRGEVVIATKVGTDFAGRPGGGDPAHINRSIRGSLSRLGTDYVDIYYLHVPDPAVPVEETLGAMQDLVEAGLVRLTGCCNLSAAQLQEAAVAALRSGHSPFGCVQDRFSLLDPALEVRRHCALNGLPFIAYAPLAEGILARGDASSSAARPGGRRLRNPDGLRRAGAFHRYCLERGLVPSQAAIAWALAQPGTTAAIPGASNAGQIAEAALGGALTLPAGFAEDLQVLCAPARQGAEAAG